MAEHRVRVFFYGSFINPAVLEQAGLMPQQFETARLWGFDIHIGPLANVVRSNRRCVYGVVCDATHAELARLYAQDWVGTYRPEAVTVELGAGLTQPALCYIAPATRSAPPPDDYVDRIADAARDHGFPDWYIDRLESFRRS